MQPDQIGKAMEQSFSTLGRFFAEKGVTPLAPPLAIYSDWNGRLVTIDVGFPVTEADAAKASGEVKAGKTPAGPAVKTVHRGSYDKLKDTYAELDEAMKARGQHPSGRCWEIYFDEPGKTPEADLVTEIYMQLSEPAAKSAS